MVVLFSAKQRDKIHKTEFAFSMMISSHGNNFLSSILQFFNFLSNNKQVTISSTLKSWSQSLV